MTILFVCIFLLWFILSLPRQLFNTPTSFVLTDRNENLLSASIAADGQWRFPYNAIVPEKFKQCILVQEDKRFMYHPGIDPLALFRAVKQNFQKVPYTVVPVPLPCR